MFRTSEANMGPIISQIETIYTTNSRGDVNETLRDIIMESTVSSMVTPERLAMELMMLVAILNNNVGMEVGKMENFYNGLLFYLFSNEGLSF